MCTARRSGLGWRMQPGPRGQVLILTIVLPPVNWAEALPTSLDIFISWGMALSPLL